VKKATRAKRLNDAMRRADLYRLFDALRKKAGPSTSLAFAPLRSG
jgi:hypothetical protein